MYISVSIYIHSFNAATGAYANGLINAAQDCDV